MADGAQSRMAIRGMALVNPRRQSVARINATSYTRCRWRGVSITIGNQSDVVHKRTLSIWETFNAVIH
jgi:hypothetical protein